MEVLLNITTQKYYSIVLLDSTTRYYYSILLFNTIHNCYQMFSSGQQSLYARYTQHPYHHAAQATRWLHIICVSYNVQNTYGSTSLILQHHTMKPKYTQGTHLCSRDLGEKPADGRGNFPQPHPRATLPNTSLYTDILIHTTTQLATRCSSTHAIIPVSNN